MPSSGRERRLSAPRWLGTAVLSLMAVVEPWAGAQVPTARVRGTVTGPDDAPIVAAAVRVWPVEVPSTVFEASTDDRGRWRLSRLPLGRYGIEITAEGHLPAEGSFDVSPTRDEAVVDVELRSLDETPPAFAENASSVLRWIERGNALLAQGKTSDARVEYERSLPLIAREQRPEVLQAIARTHFVEGEVESAIERLQQAVGIAPDDAELRQLFLAVLDSTGRSDQAERLLAEAESAAAAAVPERPQPPRGSPPELLPMVEATAGRTGRFRTRFAERSPLSGIETYRERLGTSEADLREVDSQLGVYDLASESFHVYVPESYSEDRPHGLLIWASPTPYGGFGNPGFERIFAERRLIWIGAHDAGNSRWGWYRVGLALDAVHNAQRLWAIDEDRIYVAGYSGGGRISSQLSMLYPEVFDGGFFLYGVDYFEQLPVPDRPGAYWPARFPAPSKEVRRRILSESRFVILTGDRDFNRAQSKAIHRRMETAGFEHLTYLQIPGADHYFGLPPEWLEKGLDALDG